MKKVLGFGGATADLHIKCGSPVLLRDSNPSIMSTSPGGVMRNILDNAGRLGLDCALLSAMGSDPNGRMLLDSCRELNIDTASVLISDKYPTACYMDLLGPDGDMFVAANDMAVIENIPEDYPESRADEIASAKALVIDANPREGALKRFCEIAKAPVFADPVSVAKGGRLLPVLPELYLIKPNEMELELLSGRRCGSEEEIKAAAAVLLEKGCHSVAVSLGRDGCYYADRNGESFFERLRPVENMVNATGAGDAFMAGLLFGYMNGLSPREMVRRALACGRLAVQSKTTINPEMSQSRIEKELEYGS